MFDLIEQNKRWIKINSLHNMQG